VHRSHGLLALGISCSSLLLGSACSDAVSGPNLWTIEDCAISIFTYKYIHPVVKSVVPGSGVGVGAVTGTSGSGSSPSSTSTHFYDFKATAVGTLNGSYLLEGTATLRIHDHPRKAQGAVTNLVFYVRHSELAEMDFYGIGGGTSLDDLAVYKEKFSAAGVQAFRPTNSYLGFGGTVEGLRPRISGVGGSSAPSVGQAYTETTAPGIARQPNMVHAEAYVGVNYPADPPLKLSYKIGYNYYHDLDFGAYSFHNFEADVRHSIPLRVRTSMPMSGKGFLGWLCPPRGGGKECEFGNISLNGLLTLSRTGSDQKIPFYLQPTLGGTDIHDMDTLRGFADYRFRGPDRAMVQMQFDRPIAFKIKGEERSPLGFVAFYDVGHVGEQSSDLSWKHLRHDFGIGLSTRALNRVYVRAYIAFGGGEASRLGTKLPSLF
jgi:hypothetical protein